MERRLAMVLRLGFAMCFIGHGVFGLMQKRDWLPFFDLFGIGEPLALQVMPLVGSFDIAVGLAALFAPIRLLFVYGAVWCVYTAALRPASGQSVGELVERAGNYGIPIALLAATAGQRYFARIGSTFSASGLRAAWGACAWTTALLLAGHGWLALQAKPLLIRHFSIAGLDAGGVPVIGTLELMLALAVVLRPSKWLFITVAVWKLATESLFIVDGAPIWEFIERGGSYAAPIAAAGLMAKYGLPAAPPWPLLRVATTLALGGLLPATLSAQAPSSAPPPLTPALIDQLRGGGLIVACRHGITGHDQEDRQPVNFDDPSTQRILSPEGAAQAAALGKAMAGLKITFAEVLASPFQRTRLTAELIAGHVRVDEALSSMARGKDDQLRALLSGSPKPGTNRLVITHQGLLYRAFPTLKHGSVGEGECLVVRPGETSGDVVAQVKPADWR